MSTDFVGNNTLDRQDRQDVMFGLGGLQSKFKICIFEEINWSVKMKTTTLLLATIAVIGLVGCSKTDNFTPAATASGEDIFNLNCTKCHKPNTDGSAMVLNAAVANKDAIIKKVQTGSMSMAAFPNITGEPANRLAEYVLANSKTK